MLRKLFVGVVVFALICTFGINGYCIDDDTLQKFEEDSYDESGVSINIPEDNFKTSETTMFLTVQAKERSIITIDVYYVKPINQIGFMSNFNLPLKLEEPINEEYEYQYSKTYEIGDLGFITEELELKEGRNKIAIYVQREGKVESIIIRYITVSNVDYAKEGLEDIKYDSPMDRMKIMIPKESLVE